MNWTLGQQKFYRRQVAEIAEATGEFSDDARRDFLNRITGKRSTSELDRMQMKRVIDEQRRLLQKLGRGRPVRPRQPRTVNQDEYVALLAERLGWTDQPERLNGMIRRQTGGWKNSLEALNREDKSLLIVALKALADDIALGNARKDRPPEARRPSVAAWSPQIIT